MSASIAYDALTMPPKPPNTKRIMPSAGPLNAGSAHGSERTVPKNPRTPLRCAASSNAAKIENAVMIEGITTPYVVMVCSHFQPAEMPGSRNSWWMPTGVESSTSMMKTRRVRASLNTLPPKNNGTMLYQIKYAPMIQKYTSGWPKYQNNMRVNMTLTVGVQPSDQGMRKNSISTATPIVATNHM